jgi:hypothetical protein
VFEAFDAASPSLVTGRREESTVATQALLLLNHPWIREQAAAAATRLAGDSAADPAATLDAVYRSLLARPPSEGERRLALAHLGPAPTHDAWTSLIHTLWASVDFRFVR